MQLKNITQKFNNNKIAVTVTFLILVIFLLVSSIFEKNKGDNVMPNYSYKEEENKNRVENISDKENSGVEENADEFTNKEQGTVKDSDFKEIIKGEVTFSNWLKEIYTKYPWYGEFPISTDEYTIIWDLEYSKFRVIIKTSETSPRDLKDKFIANAIESIKEIVGDNFNQDSYYIIYTN